MNKPFTVLSFVTDRATVAHVTVVIIRCCRVARRTKVVALNGQGTVALATCVHCARACIAVDTDRTLLTLGASCVVQTRRTGRQVGGEARRCVTVALTRYAFTQLLLLTTTGLMASNVSECALFARQSRVSWRTLALFNTPRSLRSHRRAL